MASTGERRPGELGWEVADVSDSWLSVQGPVGPERVDNWRKICGACYLGDHIWLSDAESFNGEVRRRQLDDLLLLNVETEPFGSRFALRSPASGFVGVSVSRKPYAERIVLRDRTQWKQETDLVVWDHEIVAESEILSPAAMTVAFVPKTSLFASSGLSFTLLDAIEQDAPGVRLLKDLLLAVSEQADRLPPLAAAAARDAIVDLLLAIAQDRPRSSNAAVSDAMRVSIARWVDEHLHLGCLSPGEAADHHKISVRSLHRLFAGSGETFGSLVRRRRLDRARRNLISTDDMVQTIATRWGYADASHFISEFRRAHGTTPAEYRASRSPGAGAPEVS
jgi:AraC family transcriptional activator of tynA and feaB